MAGSTSRGYRYPTNTDAPNVAVDIQNLATDVNADVANNLGLFLVNTTSMTTTANTYNIDNVFTSAFRNYKIIVSTGLTNASSSGILQLRAGGVTETSTANYAWAGRYIYYSISQILGIDEGDSVTGSWKLPWAYNGLNSNTGKTASLTIDIMQPQLAQQTHYYASGLMPALSSGGSMGQGSYAGMHQLLTAYDGFKLTFGSGVSNTYTGVIKTYGYN